MKPYLIFLLVAAAASVAGAEPVDSAQRRCFCLKLAAPDSLELDFVMKMDWEECAGRDTAFLEGRTMYDLGLLRCDDLISCLTPSKKEVKKREAALQRVADLVRGLKECCPKGRDNCDKDCVARFEPKLQKAKAASAKLENKSLRRQDACIANKKPVSPPAAPVTKPVPDRTSPL